MATNEQMRADKPNREDFKSQEEFEEAMGYWRTHQGRILALREEEEYRRQQLTMHEEYIETLNGYLRRAQDSGEREE